VGVSQQLQVGIITTFIGRSYMQLNVGNEEEKQIDLNHTQEGFFIFFPCVQALTRTKYALFGMSHDSCGHDISKVNKTDPSSAVMVAKDALKDSTLVDLDAPSAVLRDCA
jgi:hypothetical protein